jgi:hypothetical protein
LHKLIEYGINFYTDNIIGDKNKLKNMICYLLISFKGLTKSEIILLVKF